MTVNGLAVGGGIALGIGGAVAIGGLIHRNSVQEALDSIPEREQKIQELTTSVANAQETLEATIPAAPKDAKDAVAVAREHLGTGIALTARNGAGDEVLAGVGQVVDQAYGSQEEAARRAKYEAHGLGSATVKVGDYYVPVVLDDALTPREHTRRVPYTTTEYTYHYGYDSYEDDWHYHYGPETVTRYRDEDYLSRFDRFTPEQYGLDAAATGAGLVMRNQGTTEQQALVTQQNALRSAQDGLADAQDKTHDVDGAGKTAMFIGGGLASLGVLALAVKGVSMLR